MIWETENWGEWEASGLKPMSQLLLVSTADQRNPEGFYPRQGPRIRIRAIKIGWWGAFSRYRIILRGYGPVRVQEVHHQVATHYSANSSLYLLMKFKYKGIAGTMAGRPQWTLISNATGKRLFTELLPVFINVSPSSSLLRPSLPSFLTPSPCNPDCPPTSASWVLSILSYLKFNILSIVSFCYVFASSSLEMTRIGTSSSGKDLQKAQSSTALLFRRMCLSLHSRLWSRIESCQVGKIAPEL